MNRSYFISDLHLGHANILKFEPELRPGSTIDQHDDIIIDRINTVVNKKDTLYVLGDVAFSRDGLARLESLRCQNRILIRGNHDGFKTQEYLEHFKHVFGIIRYKHYWLSHAPIHPAELRGLINVHGHVHSNTIDDGRYINVCIEITQGVPFSTDDLNTICESRGHEYRRHK